METYGEKLVQISDQLGTKWQRTTKKLWAHKDTMKVKELLGSVGLNTWGESSSNMDRIYKWGIDLLWYQVLSIIGIFGKDEKTNHQ